METALKAIGPLLEANPWIGSIVLFLIVAGPAWFAIRKVRGSEAVELVRIQLEERRAFSAELKEARDDLVASRQEVRAAREETHAARVELQSTKVEAQRMLNEVAYLTDYTHWLADYIEDLRYDGWQRHGHVPPRPRTAPPQRQRPPPSASMEHRDHAPAPSH